MQKRSMIIASGLAVLLTGCERVTVEDQHTSSVAGPGAGHWRGKFESWGGKTGTLSLSNTGAGTASTSTVRLQTGKDLAEAKVEYIDSPHRHYALIAWDGKDFTQGSFVATWRKVDQTLFISVPKSRLMVSATATPRSLKQSALIAELDQKTPGDFIDVAALDPVP